MNYLLPHKDVMPMHCSANYGPNGDVAVFFGLSGTGKTTLSTDPMRTLIGDDEHGWSDDGVFNMEGGCYAKTIRLSRTAEPDIYEATCRFRTILENVGFDPTTGQVDKYGSQVWLVNTGWSGGPYGVGQRIKIPHTRAMVHGILDGGLANVDFHHDERFNVAVPASCPGVPAEVLDPRSTWADKAAYDAQASKLAAMFVKNFERYADKLPGEVAVSGPRP